MIFIVLLTMHESGGEGKGGAGLHVFSQYVCVSITYHIVQERLSERSERIETLEKELRGKEDVIIGRLGDLDVILLPCGYLA